MDDAVASVGEGDPTGATIYRGYKRRWAIMMTILLLALTGQGMFVNQAAVAYKAADYFEVSTQQITWFSQVFLIAPLPFVFVSTYIFNKFDMKAGVHIGSALTCAGGVTRAVATSGLISDISVQYAISIAGQVMAAVGQIFTVFITTKVTQNWYPDKERIMATTLMAFFPPFGISVAQVISPLLVTTKDQIPTLNYVYGGMAVLSEFATVVCVTRSRPPTPPSRSAERGKAARVPYLQQLKDTFTCLPYLILLVTTGIFSGFFVTVITLSQQILCSVGYADSFSGVVVSIFNIAGFLGSILIALVANRTKALTSINKLVNGLGVVCTIFMMEVYLVPGQHVLLIMSSLLYGVSACAVFPLGLETGVETIYPVEETISTTLLYMCAQVLGAFMTYTTTVLSCDLPPQLQQVEVCTQGITSDLQARDYSGVMSGIMVVLALTGILFILFFRTPYRRMEAERNTDMNAAAFSYGASYNPSFSDSCTRL